MESDQKISLSDFKVEECLEKGSYGSVHSVRCKQQMKFLQWKYPSIKV